MNVLLHTIALEPARWTSQRVSQSFADLLPRIAAAGFRDIEVFEPHLEHLEDEAAGRDTIAANGLNPVILSSYLNLNPEKVPENDVDTGIEKLAERVAAFGFRKVRLFAGSGMDPANAEGVRIFTARLERVASAMPATEFLIETHDGSLADDPELIVRIVDDVAAENVGLLYQPTVFEPGPALSQLAIQKTRIRHLHLQNRWPDLSFAPLAEGVIPWPEILKELDYSVDATVEFVPGGICEVAAFDLETSLQEARKEADYVRALAGERQVADRSGKAEGG